MVLRVGQAHSAWCSALSWDSEATEIRRRSFLRFPCPQDRHSILRIQRVASMNPCDSLSQKTHTSTLAWRKRRIRSHRRPQCCLWQSHPALQARSCGLWPLGMSLDLRCRPLCCSVRTFTIISHKLSTFSPPGPTYRSPCTEPFDGFRSIFGHSSGSTTDSPAPESTVISRYRPRSPSVSTQMLSMDMLLIVTVFSSTSSGSHSSHGATSIGTSTGRHSPHWRCRTGEWLLANVGCICPISTV